MQNQLSQDIHYWTNSLNTPTYNTWLGLAFERLCLQHVQQIKHGLSIGGVICDVYSWTAKASDENKGAQIDMLIDRKDGIIDICELKYSAGEYHLNSEEEERIANKCHRFIEDYPTTKAVHVALITTNKKPIENNSDFVQNILIMNDLFAF